MSAATDELMVCVEPHFSDDGLFQLGQEVRASHPAVARCPQYFVPASTPRAEWPVRWYDRAIEIGVERERVQREDRQRRFQEQARLNPVSLAVPDVARAKVDFAYTVNGEPAWIKRGSLVLVDSDIYLSNQPAFEIKRVKT